MADKKKSKNNAKEPDAEVIEVTEPDTAGETPEPEPETEQKIEPEKGDLLEQERDKFLRLAAEYDNFRKRSAKERLEVTANTRADTVTRLLPVLDNLERALESPCEDESFYKGVEMIKTQFCEILATLGVEAIAAAGEQFDPERHNAVSQVSEDGVESGVITMEFQKGYTMDGKVIRHSVVQVNS